ncbi:MAG: DNA primase [Planctomycetota bacterium]|nr:DNA primase [Planctomycetota bacterium]
MSHAAGSPLSLQDAKERIRQSIDIVELVGRYLELRPQGRIFVALCPWHNDSRPSLQVNPERQSWKCWPCDLGGDIFSFVMQQEGVEFGQALRILAEITGIALAPTRASSHSAGTDKDVMYRLSAWAEAQFHDCLVDQSDGQEAREYLQERGISHDSIARYRIGYSPASWQWIVDRARNTEFSTEALEKVGIVCRSQRSGKHFDRFRGRAVFPIRDPMGRTIAFGGRILPKHKTDDQTAKYVNSPESPLYSKSHQLYGLDVARDAIRKKGEVVVMEGYTDVVAARQAGLLNGVAVLGTALTAFHLQLLRRFCDRVVLLLDGDEAGQRRTNEILELFVAQQVDLRIVTLPEGLDPCDFVHQRGIIALETEIAQAKDALEHKMTTVMQGLDPRRDTHQIHQSLEELLGLMSRAPRHVASTGQGMQLREQQILTRLSRQFQLPAEDLRKRLNDLRRKSPASSAARPRRPEDRRQLLQDLGAMERELLELLTQYPEAMDVLRLELDVREIHSAPAREIYDVYLEFAEQGQIGEFTRVLASFDSPLMKNLLVEIDEAAAAKWQRAISDGMSANAASPQERLQALVAALHRGRADQERTSLTRVLDNDTLDESEEIRLLKSLCEQQKNRQGISAPTEG